ncbi:MAG: BrnT family toxin [Bosea sp. (in: a-proteobacteria)]
MLEERGIDFEDAAIALGEGPVLVMPSPKNSEDRDVGLVEIHSKVWAVVHIWRGETLRIITVRRARQREERAYRELYPRRTEGTPKLD